jgi:hypothetical protein
VKCAKEKQAESVNKQCAKKAGQLCLHFDVGSENKIYLQIFASDGNKSKHRETKTLGIPLVLQMDT